MFTQTMNVKNDKNNNKKEDNNNKLVDNSFEQLTI